MQLSTNIALINLANQYYDSEIDVQLLFECRHFQILRNKKGLVHFDYNEEETEIDQTCESRQGSPDSGSPDSGPKPSKLDSMDPF